MTSPVKSKYLILGSGILFALGVGYYLSQIGVVEKNVFEKNTVEEVDATSVTKASQATQNQNTSASSDQGVSAKPLVHDHSSEKASSYKEENILDMDAGLEDSLGFSSVEDLLDNIEDPRVQKYIESLPDEAQESFYIASLKQSVSKRLDEMEETGVLSSDPQTLFEDIDTLGRHGLMMPGELENLKAYIRQRL